MLELIFETLASLKDRQIVLQEGVQSLPQLKERFGKLVSFVTSVTAEINDLRAKTKPLEQNLKAAVEEKDRLKERERKKLAELNTQYNSYKSTDQDIQR